MIYNNLLIKVLNTDSNPEVQYSKIMTPEEDLAIRARVILLAQKICKQLAQSEPRHIEQISFNFKNKDKVAVIVSVDGGQEIKCPLDSLDLEIKQLLACQNKREPSYLQKLIRFVQRHFFSHPGIQATEKNDVLTQSDKSSTPFMALDVSPEKLVKIPLTADNQEQLVKTWKQLLNNCFTKGHLENLSISADLQTSHAAVQYASNYLRALKMIPAPIKKELDPFLQDLNKRQPTQKIRDFLLQVSISTNLETVDPKFENEAKIYKEKIQPLFKEWINARMKDPYDAYDVVKLLAFEGSADVEINRILQQVSSKLSYPEKVLFHQDHLKELLFNNLEKEGVANFQFSPLQLENFKKARDNNQFIVKQKETFIKNKKTLLDALKNYEKAKLNQLGSLNPTFLLKLNDKKQKEWDALIQRFMNQFDNFIGQFSPSMDLLNEINFDPSRSEIDVLMRQYLLKKIFDQSRVMQIDPQTGITPEIKQQMERYKEAKVALHACQVTEGVRSKFNVFIEQLESRIPNSHLQEYLKTVSAPQGSRLSRLLFSEDVLDTLQTGEKVKSPFSVNELVDLMVLTRVMLDVENGGTISEDDRLQIQQILQKYKGNQKLRQKIKQLSPEAKRSEDFMTYVPSFLKGLVKKFVKTDQDLQSPKIPLGISLEIIDFLKVYLAHSDFKEKNAQLMIIQTKANDLIAKYHSDPTQIETKDKLTLSEVGLLSHFAILSKKLKKFGKIFDCDPELLNLIIQSERSQKLFIQIDEIIRPAWSTHYKDGSLLAYVGKKKNRWLGKALPLEERLTAYTAGGFTHGAKLYHQNDDLYISHLYGELIQEELSLYQLCISDIWELDIVPLVNPTISLTLQNIYGNNWQNILNQRYQAIENELHIKGSNRFKKFSNYSDRRVAAGFADHPFLFKLLGQGNIKGHQKKFDGDFNKLHRRFFGKEALGEEQICSEFASKVTLASMIELNKELSKATGNALPHFKGDAILQQLRKKNIDLSSEVENYLKGVRYIGQDSPKTEKAKKELIKILRAQNYSLDDINLVIRIGNEEIFDFPYKRNERLKAIHPGRMVKLLVDKKCAKLKPKPTEFNALINL
jgi:hypothetical protein